MFTEFTEIGNVEVKKRSNGEDMIVVTVKKYVHAFDVNNKKRYPLLQ